MTSNKSALNQSGRHKLSLLKPDQPHSAELVTLCSMHIEKPSENFFLENSNDKT